MKRLFTAVAFLSLSFGLQAQSSLLSFGLRGGANMYLTQVNLQSPLSGNGFVDIGYTYYWKTKWNAIGIHTGLIAGYGVTRFSGDENRSFINTDYEGENIQYTTTATGVFQRIQSVQLEVPLMLALRSDQFVIHIGAKGMVPILSPFTQSMESLTIDAYYSEADVHVINRLITGTADESQTVLQGKKALPWFHIVLGVEAGYEWKLNVRDRIRLALYFDISPWNSATKSEVPAIIKVAPITNPLYPPAEVTINPITQVYGDKTRYCDFGIKFYYGLNIEKRNRLQ